MNRARPPFYLGVSESLQPTNAARSRMLPNSLMSAAHTVKPSLEPRSAQAVLQPRRKLSLKIVALAAVSAGLGLAGAASLSHLRARPAPIMQIVSGNPALKKGADGDSVRWHRAKQKIYFDASLEAAGAHGREAVQLGFGTWLGSGAKVPELDFDSTQGARFGQVPNGKSEVMYGPITLAGHENDLALTVTFSDPKSGEVVESDMIFNSRHSYGVLPYKTATGNSNSNSASSDDSASSCEQRYDLQSVATHEAGHFFGLGEDFEAKPATMYYTTGRCETNKRVLQNSDETTMAALYVSNDMSANSDDPEGAKGCGGARIGQGKTNGAIPAFSLLSLLGFVALRRRRH